MNEGLQGFARTALAGGIPCLLASKWNVPTVESIILMTRVYAFMAMNKVWEKGELQPLRLAMMVVMLLVSIVYLNRRTNTRRSARHCGPPWCP